MAGSIEVFVRADEPGVQAGVVSALSTHADVVTVDSADQASWMLVVTSASSVDADGGEAPTEPRRVVALVTSVPAERGCRHAAAALAALLGAPGANGQERPPLPEAGLSSLAAALTLTAGRPSALTPKETAVLGLVAAGQTTAEIAALMSYSERSVKNVVHGVTERLVLRNRSHAVAHAIRQGWI